MHLVFFDLDNTLLKGNISFHFFRYLFFQKQIALQKLIYPCLQFFKYRWRYISLNELHLSVFEKFLQGLSIPYLNKFIPQFLASHLDNLLNKKVLEHLQNYLERKDQVCLLSSSPYFLVYPVARMLNIPIVLATRYVVDEVGKIQKILTFVEGEKKMRFAKKIAKTYNIEKEHIIGYSDSYDDLPMLKLCAKVFLVNPDRLLKKEKFNQQWIILRNK